MALTAEQRRVAVKLIRVGKRMGAPKRDIITALTTALVEANLGNPAGGHGTSVGWRQEISTYGSVAERRNIARSAARFYRELRQIGQGGSIGSRAQAVQRSAYPGRYATKVGDARSIYRALAPGAGAPGAAGKSGGRIRVPGQKEGNLYGGPLSRLISEVVPAPPPTRPLRGELSPRVAGPEVRMAQQGGRQSVARLTPGEVAPYQSRVEEREVPLPAPSRKLLKAARADLPGYSIRVPGQQDGKAVPGGGQAMGRVRVSPGADRPGVSSSKAVLNFARQVAGIYGGPLTIGTGTNHSRMTVSGNVSDHWSGNAVDIPASGKALLRMGRAALMAAGMSRKRAKRARGGLYNVGGHQIIFLTNEGGNHYDHLHISA